MIPIPRLTILLALAVSPPIVIRPGVPDAKYLVPDSAFPALADLPYEGHGVLIAPRWVLTAAHATSMIAAMPNERYVTIAGLRRRVLRVIVYPGFAKSAAAFDVFNDQVGLGHVAAADSLLPDALHVQAGMHDLALLELARPVEDVKPVPIYRGTAERGRVVKLFGKGATGTGTTGEAPQSPHRGALRRAFNRVTRADGQWLVYRFDCDSAALPLEGALGHGDSGGPALIDAHGRWMLAGIAHGMYLEQGMRFTYRNGRFESGLCGQDFAYTRVSYFAGWIDSVTTGRRETGDGLVSHELHDREGKARHGERRGRPEPEHPADETRAYVVDLDTKLCRALVDLGIHPFAQRVDLGIELCGALLELRVEPREVQLVQLPQV